MATRTLYDEAGNPFEVEFTDQGEEQDPPKPRTNSEWAQQRHEQKAQKALERENAFLKAGINPEDKSNPMASYFVKGYDGPLDSEAIKKAATEAGILGDTKEEPPAPPTTKDTTPKGDDGETQGEPSLGNPDAERRIFEAALGAGLDDPTFVSARAKLEEAASKGGTAALVAQVRELGLPVAEDY